MSKLYEDFKGGIYYSSLIFGSTILITLLLHIINIFLLDFNVFGIEDKNLKFDAFFKMIGVAIALTGFISVVVTIVQSRKNIQREIQKNTINLFTEFRSEKMNNARSIAWKAKKKWDAEMAYRERYLNHNFKETPDTEDKELKEESRAIYVLLEFYLIVSNYEGNRDSLKTFRYFYYGWWRRFLYEISTQIEKNRSINLLVHQYNKEYLESISYLKSLERLDKICGFDKIPKHEEIHFNGG